MHLYFHESEIGKNFPLSYCGIKKYTYLCTRKRERCHSSVGRAKDWKSLCPRFDSWWHHFKEKKTVKSWFPNGIRIFCFLTKRKYHNIDWMTRYTSLGIRNNEHPVLHSEDKTSPETGIRKRDGNAYPARYNERRNRKNEKGSKHRLCACNFRQVGQESRFIIFIDDMFGKE